MSVASPTPRANSSVVLEDRRLDPPVARAGEDLGRGDVELRAGRGILGQDVEGAPGGLEPLGHGRARLVGR